MGVASVKEVNVQLYVVYRLLMKSEVGDEMGGGASSDGLTTDVETRDDKT